MDLAKTYVDIVPFSEQAKAEAIKKELNELCRSICPKKDCSPIERKNISFCERRTTTKEKRYQKVIPASHTKKQQKARKFMT